MPVVFASTYVADGAFVYGRTGNPTWDAFEAAVGALEGGAAVVFASGLAAVSAVLAGLPDGATVVAPGDAYAGTRRVMLDAAARGRLQVRAVEVADTAATLAACDRADLVWLESPTNPLMAVADLEPLIAGAHDAGCVVAVDNTFATPLLQRPLEIGADLVVHSATKFLAGHSDVVLGVVVAADAGERDRLAAHRTLHGAVPGPMEVFLALRGLRTLAVRLERSQATAGELARRLDAHPAVERVRYPGLAGCPGHDVARRQMRGFGGVVAFDVAGGAPAADAVCGTVRLIVPSTSLGGVESQIERRHRWEGEEGTPPGLLRLSVGLEHVDDLWADLSRALTHPNLRQ